MRSCCFVVEMIERKIPVWKEPLSAVATVVDLVDQ